MATSTRAAWLLLLLVSLTLVSTCLCARVERRCPSNITLEAGDGWTACWFPDIVSNQRGCGRARNDTWTYRLCDPNYLIKYDDGWAVEAAVRDAEITTPFTCYNTRDAAINYTFAFAILNSIRVPDLSSPDLCINDCGAILPELKSREPTEEELDVAMETLTNAVQAKWKLAVCGNDVITVYTQKYQRALTVVGSKASSSLSTSRLKSITSGAVDYYFRRGQYKSGINYLVAAYKQSLLGFSPAYALLVITGGLLVFVAGVLYFVFSIGRETNVLYDESAPTKGLKVLLYFVSLIWIVKGGLMFLGWVLTRPKVRFVYIIAPITLCMLGIFLAWLASPKINSGTK